MSGNLSQKHCDAQVTCFLTLNKEVDEYKGQS